MSKITTSLILFIALFLWSCGGSKIQKSPIDLLVRDMPSKEVFSIVLYDMDVEGSLFRTYKHQYRIIKENNGNPQEVKTDWYEVDKRFFRLHENDMGMEIAARDSTGKLRKIAAPAGYSNYVGNPRYGQWRERNGSSFWEFYGKYAMLNSIFNMGRYPVRRSYWNDYRSFSSTGRPYYGPKVSGSRYYGTYGSATQASRKNSRWNSKASNRSFRNRVNSSTSRSSRSGSRYSSRSSRSRSGGSGK